eukprot:TRINITY_DN11683_c0_g1_i6.p1 TRINITY_DN11683_c0_g1~~TRINITY_DN11683_c0_g1_i6.p1  ORF type:complete len:975 (-),score=172.36 TRINITY_DN11683_c0_g1_i6:79-3003(-)
MSGIAPQGRVPKSCRCRKSKCLKLYCECFTANEICAEECKCVGCENTARRATERTQLIKLNQENVAYEPKFRTFTPHELAATEVATRGCSCRRSGCRKKYCDCFNMGVQCTPACKCVDCVNDGRLFRSQDTSVRDWVLPRGKEPTCSAIGVESVLQLPSLPMTGMMDDPPDPPLAVEPPNPANSAPAEVKQEPGLMMSDGWRGAAARMDFPSNNTVALQPTRFGTTAPSKKSAQEPPRANAASADWVPSFEPGLSSADMKSEPTHVDARLDEQWGNSFMISPSGPSAIADFSQGLSEAQIEAVVAAMKQHPEQAEISPTQSMFVPEPCMMWPEAQQQQSQDRAHKQTQLTHIQEVDNLSFGGPAKLSTSKAPMQACENLIFTWDAGAVDGPTEPSHTDWLATRGTASLMSSLLTACGPKRFFFTGCTGQSGLGQLEANLLAEALCDCGTLDLVVLDSCEADELGEQLKQGGPRRRRAIPWVMTWRTFVLELPTYCSCRGAASGGHDKLMEVLCNKGIDLCHAERNGKTHAHWAAAKGHEQCLVLMARRGADLTAKDMDGSTAVHLAASGGHAGCIAVLAGLHVDLRVRNAQGDAPAHLAAQKGNVACLKMLHQHGVDMGAESAAGSTPMQLASSAGHSWCVRVLQEFEGPRVPAKGTWLHASPLAPAQWQPTVPAASGADSASQSLPAMSPRTQRAQHACHQGCLLCDSGKDDAWIELSHKQRTAAHSAAFRGHTKCLEALSQQGADLNAVDANGCTTVHLAALGGHPACLVQLHQRGAAFNAFANCGKLPMHLAAEQGHAECLEVMRELGLNLGVADLVGRTTAHWAAAEGHDASLQLLHSNVLSKADQDGNTPAHMAAEFGHPACLVVLSDREACLSVPNAAGATPSHLAALGGHPDCLAVLHKLGVDLSVTDSDGDTPATIASLEGHTECVDVLNSLGCASSIKKGENSSSRCKRRKNDSDENKDMELDVD